ncbi:MAG: RNA polymerase sigma factor [Actinobacteria bacterium]|nr:RNA polymerase sigma factor [Actinomycetota bacterium]
MGTELHPDVLDAARAGAGWAFERLYTTLAPAVHGYLRAQGARDPDGAVSDVFLRVFRRIGDFDGDAGRFRSWVFVIAHNLLLDERRYAGRRPTEVLVDLVPDAGTAADAADDALARLTDTRLRRLLDLLAPDQRDVLLLRFLVDLSLEETAQATRRSVTAVKALQRRGLDALRRRLDEVAVAIDLDGMQEISPPPVSPPDPTTFTRL